MKFNHTAHKKLWKYLEDNPEMEKEDWPGWDLNGGEYKKILNDCFACEYLFATCSSCPLLWPKVKGEWRVCHSGGLYEKWCTSGDVGSRSSLAHQIANLPVKEGVETE